MAKPASKTKPSRSLETPPAGPGSYVLVLHLPDPVRLTIGKLGEFDFQVGWYLYSGSAMNGLRGRIARHLRSEHRVHWHIDYLNSSTTGATVEAVGWAEGKTRQECEWATAIADLPGSSRPVPGFGSSDCACESHLVHSPGDTEFNAWIRQNLD
ncbi:MAG: GIY-YIG nuclease family protein [Dehalococcoidia bacterium]|jgi:Uri superfamily endonuclease|nr:GIY-YIG nuclease family protein [Dehalococcoidia bacterium]